MIDSKTEQTVQKIWLRTRRLVTQLFAGEYSSAYRGQGIEFEEVREYVPGDDIRSIDWNVTARTGKPHIKRFREERELSVLLAVDLSASLSFGSGETAKRDLAAEIASVLAYTAGLNNDLVGCCLFTDRVESYIPPQKGMAHSSRIVKEILTCRPEGRKTSLNTAVEYLGKVLRRQSIVFFLSDFQDPGFKADSLPFMRKHEVIAIDINDRSELELPKVGLVRLQDAESGQIRFLDTSSATVRTAWEQKVREKQTRLEHQLKGTGWDYVCLASDEDWFHILSTFFYKRTLRRRR